MYLLVLGPSSSHCFDDIHPWENGYIESFEGKLRDEVLNREIFYMLMEAWVLMER